MSASTPNAFLNIDDAHLRVTSGNVYAQGLNISGVSFSGVSGLHTVTNTGNVTTNTLEFKNGAKAFVATSNVEVKGSLDVANVATIYNGSNADYDQKQKFTSTVSSSGNYFANTLAMSTNGLYAIVGAHGENKTYTFTRSGSTWTQEHTFSSTGYAVDISSHGTYAVVGANGSASVFYRSSGSTWDSGTTLTAAGISVTTGYGASVSISDDGSYAIVGATGQSAAWIFRRTGTTTWDAGVKIALTGFSLGFSVAISGDGLYALLGAHAQHTAYVFKRTGAYLWSQQAKITESDSFGYSVALSTDGSRALIGATGGNGKAYSYERAGSGWSQNAIITASDAASGDAFGSAVSLSSDGSYGIVGAPGSEKAYTFKNAGSVWTELGIETASDTASGHVFGRSVSISGDGIYALIGASGNEAAYSYERKETLVLDVRGEANVRTLNVSDDLIVSNNILVSNNLTVAGNLNVTTIRSDSNVVTEYTGPHDRPLRKYPEVALTSASQGGYVVTRSSENTSSGLYAWELFDNISTTKWLATSVDSYSTTSPFLYNGSNNSSVIDVTNTPHNGAWVKLQLPVSIKLSHVIQRDNDDPSNRVPGVVTFLGSNNGSEWTFLKEFTGLSNAFVTETMYVNSTVAYSHYAYVVKNLSDADGQLDLGELEYYGHEEGSGSLDTTLKTVYNVPATTGTQLEVYYDAKGESTVQSPIPDLSPNTNTGAVVGHSPTLDNNSFVFDGVDDYIESTLTNDNGAWIFSKSLWFKQTTGVPGANYSCISSIGDYSESDATFFYLNDTHILVSIYSSGVYFPSEWVVNEWTHAVVVMKGTTSSINDIELYINGKKVEATSQFGTATTRTLPTNAQLRVGREIGVGTSYFTGSIANFRLYSKALNADQVKELYDYQKDYFLGSKSQVTLYKGHLGVGVTEPSGQLELAGDERIQEYPPRALTGYETLVEGHGVFCQSSVSTISYMSDSEYLAYPFSSVMTGLGYQTVYVHYILPPAGTSLLMMWYGSGTGVGGTATGATYAGSITDLNLFPGAVEVWMQKTVNSSGGGVWQAIGYKNPADGTYSGTLNNGPFNKNEALTDYWESAASTYTSTSGGSPAVSTSGSERLVSNAPYGSWVTLKLPYEICLKRYEFTGAGTKSPKEGQIWGSTDGTTWSHVHTFTGGVADVKNNETVSGNTNYYSEYAFITTKITGADTVVRVVEIRYFGTPGPTTLDKGSLTLGRSLDVPRVSRYDVDTETPRPEKLVLDFDTTVNSSPTDISGKGNHGSFKGTNMNYSSADKAFVFNGTDDYIQTAPLGFSGDQVHSVSLWFWSDIEQSTFGNNEHALCGTGGVSNSTETGISIYNAYAQVWRAGGATKYPMTFNANQWNHICMAYSSGGSVNSRLWLNGVELAQDSSVTSTSTYSFQTGEYLILGTWINNATVNTNYTWDGKMSNFKLYKAALENSEVKKLYNLGRTGRSMVISDTAVGIGKVPEAQLDVRGNLNVDGVITNQKPAFYAELSNASSLSRGPGVAVFNDALYNRGACYDASTGLFTAPITGAYKFHCYGYGESVSRPFWVRPWLNGSYWARGPYSVYCGAGEWIVPMNAGDTLGMYLPSSNYAFYLGGDRHNGFSGYLVG